MEVINKKLIYTVCTGNYDQVKRPKVYQGFDYWLFTDDKFLNIPGWTTKVLPKSDNPCKQQRDIKINSYIYTKGYDVTIYHDANIELTNNPNQLIKSIFKGGFMTTIHARRRSIIAEAEQILALRKDTKESLDRTIKAVKDAPTDFGLWETGILVRDKSAYVKALEEAWWDMVKKYSHRDQMTLPYASAKTGVNIHGIRRPLMYSFFKLNLGHFKPFQSDAIKIWYGNPFSVQKNIGGAYNEFIKGLNAKPDDWIVLQDGDMMYLTPDWGKRINDALAKDGQYYGLVGCYTNRLRGVHQLHENKFSDDRDILNHYRIAQSYQGEGIQEIKLGVAGFFMAFQYKTWKKIGGFKENNIACDSIFNSEVRNLGLKVGLIRSLYVFHLYRIWAKEKAWESKDHLK